MTSVIYPFLQSNRRIQAEESKNLSGRADGGTMRTSMLFLVFPVLLITIGCNSEKKVAVSLRQPRLLCLPWKNSQRRHPLLWCKSSQLCSNGVAFMTE